MYLSLLNTSLHQFLCCMKRQWRNDILIKEIACKLKELRTTKDVSQEAVYESTGVHIGKIETEQYNITVSTLSKLCNYYEITLEDFFKGMKGKEQIGRAHV